MGVGVAVGSDVAVGGNGEGVLAGGIGGGVHVGGMGDEVGVNGVGVKAGVHPESAMISRIKPILERDSFFITLSSRLLTVQEAAAYCISGTINWINKVGNCPGLVHWWIFAKMSKLLRVCKSIIANKILPVNTNVNPAERLPRKR
jgi:hypothetical protein